MSEYRNYYNNNIVEKTYKNMLENKHLVILEK